MRMNRIRSFLLIALLILVVISFLKGSNSGIQEWGQPYWLIDYGHGFVKRGLVGQLFGWVTSGNSLDKKWNSVMHVHLASCILLLTGLSLWACRISIDLTTIVVLSVFVSSQFSPTLAYITGYLDVYLYILLGVSMFSVAHGWFLPAVVLGFIAPFIHESYVFPWMTLPTLLIRARLGCTRETMSKSALVVMSPLAASIAVSVIHSPSAIRDVVAKLPLSEVVKDGLMRYQFGQTIQSSLSIMASKMLVSGGNLLICLIFFGLPTVLILLTYINGRELTTREKALIWLASCAPITILGLAWDLSRFIVMTNICALFSVFFVETAWRPRRKTLPRTMTIAVGVLTIGYLASPFVYTYFENAHEFRPEWLPVRPALFWLFSTVYR